MHAGAVIVPAVLAACERHEPTGLRRCIGIAVGVETHLPAERRGAEGRAQGRLSSDRGVRRHGGGGRRRRRARARSPRQTGRRARHRRLDGGRHHRVSRRRRLDQAAASGLGGAIGPARGAARRAPASSARAPCSKACTACSTASPIPPRATTTRSPAISAQRWVTETLAFKPYPCGTMTHPYIDCARRLAARGSRPRRSTELVCEVGEGTVHRLWEPLAAKQKPPNGYAGKFSTPYCIAAGFVRGNVGLERFLRRRRARSRRARARRQGALPHRSARILIRTISPATSAPCSPTAASSRSASRTCAAAPTSR